MRTFRAFFILEFKRFFSTRNAAVMLLFLCLCLWLVNFGVTHYQDLKKGSKEFQDVVNEKVRQFPTYDMYGGYGIHLYFMPAPSAILFHNSGLFSQLICRMDVGEILDAYDLFKGKNIFAEKPGKLLDFSGFFLLLGSLIALFYGFEAFRNKEYLRFLASRFWHRRVFALIWFSRVVLLSMYFTFVTLCAVGFLFLRGILVQRSDFGHLVVFLIVKLMLLVFFFTVGCLAGNMQSRLSGLFMVFFWMLSVYFIPSIVTKMVEAGAHNITSNFESELNKLTKLMDFERWAIGEMEKRKKAGEVVTIKDLPQFYTEYFKKIQELESKLLAETEVYVSSNKTFSTLFPSTFYLSLNSEISSRGYQGILEFYRYAAKIKDKFIDFLVKKRSEELAAKEKGQRIKVVSFIKGDENIFEGKSLLPFYFPLGIVVTFLYIVVFSYWAYAVYKRTLFFLPQEEEDGLQDLKIEIEKGVANVVLTRGMSIKHYLYNVLSGKSKGFKGQVLVEGVDIGMVQRKVDFVYLCHPEEMPGDIKSGDFILFILGTLKLPRGYLPKIAEKLKLTGLLHKHLNDLEDEQTGSILLEAALLDRPSIYLLDNFTRGLAGDFVQEFRNRMNRLKAEGAALLYLTNDVFLGRKLGEYILSLKKEAALLRVNL